jgi:ComF family protein
MHILNNLYNIFIDALFPLSDSERLLLTLAPEKGYEILPKAPEYGNHTVSIPFSKSIFAYKDERVSKLIWNIKYKKVANSVSIGGYALHREIHKLFPNTKIIIIPMPITDRRRRERGFNQCELLADEIKRLDVDDMIIIKKNLLIRTHHSSRQTLKDREDRLASAKGIFSLNEITITPSDYELLKNATIIVIDDVITTGSTIREAVGTLTNAGFKNVYAISLAH